MAILELDSVSPDARSWILVSAPKRRNNYGGRNGLPTFFNLVTSQRNSTGSPTRRSLGVCRGGFPLEWDQPVLSCFRACAISAALPIMAAKSLDLSEVPPHQW